MSDIFEQIDEQRSNAILNSYNNINERTQKTREAVRAKVEADNQAYLENIRVYRADISQDDFNKISEAIANAKIPEDESYRWATAMEFQKQFHIPLYEAYGNLEEYTAALWGRDRKFVPKTNFKAIVDYGKLGVNTVKLGELGAEIMAAQDSGDFEKVKTKMAEYEAINTENESLADYQDRNFWIEAVKFGAQTLPYTGAIAGAGIIGGLVSGGVGTVAAFATSMRLASGMEYMDLIREGATHENAKSVSLVSGALQSVVETALGNVAGALGKNALGAGAKKTITEKITGNVFKRLHYDGTFAKLALNMGAEYVKENFEEGMEEVVQDLISKGAHALAAELEGYNIEPITASKIAEDAWENFRGGLMGSLVLGVGTSAMKMTGTVNEYNKLKKTAQDIPSEKIFVDKEIDNPILEGMSKPEKEDVLRTVYTNQKSKREEVINSQAEDIAALHTADEGFEVIEPTLDENGIEVEDAEVPAEFRTENGELYTRNAIIKDDNADGTITAQFIMGDGSQTENNKYGVIDYTINEENNTVTINNFQTTEKRDYLKNEFFSEFANKYSGYDIVWDPKTKGEIAFKESLAALNPRGKEAGLNYFESGNEVENQKARVSIARELRNNLSQDKVKNEHIGALVAEFEALGKFAGLSVKDFYSNVFNNRIFGDATVAQNEALSQGQGAIRGGISISNRNDTIQGLRAVIYAAENADFSTFSHELAHLARKMAEIQGGEFYDKMNKAFNIGEEGWTVEKEEDLAYAWEDYLHTGKAKNSQLKELFDRLCKFLIDTMHALNNRIKITPEIEEVFNNLLKGDDSVLRKAEEAVAEMNSSKNQETQQNEKSTVSQNDTVSDSGTENNETTISQNETVKENLTPKEEYRQATEEALDDIIADEELTGTEKQEAVMNAAGEELRASEILDEAQSLYPADQFEEMKEWPVDFILNNEKAILNNNDLNDWYYLYQGEGESSSPITLFQSMTFEDAQKIYPNIIDISDIFNEHPTEADLKDYLRNTIGKETVSYDTKAKVVIPQNGDKRKHVVNSSRYLYLNKAKHTDEKERHDTYVLSAEELIGNSTLKKITPNTKIAKKPNVINYYHFNVPVYINGHGWMVDVVAEETKKSGAARPQNNSAASTQATTQHNNNVTLSNVQVNLYDFIETQILFQDDKTLAGIHNLSEENLQHVVKMGGLANPSLAVINTDNSDFSNFGEISLVAPKTLIAKDLGNNAGTFGADVYSPRYPNINIEVTDKGNTVIKNIIKGIEDDNFRQIVKERIRQAVEDPRPYNLNRALAVPFLLEKGNKDFYVIPELKLDQDEIDFYNKVKETVYDPLDMNAEQKKEFSDMFINKDIDKRKEKYPDLTEKEISVMRKLLIDEKTGLLNAHLMFDYWNTIRTQFRKAGQIDEYKTLDKAKDIVESKEYSKEFEEYKKEKLASIDKKERIFNGYTPSGNRRWLDHTLANVSKFMKQQAVRGGESMSYGMGSTRARVAPKWTTLTQIAKNKDRLVTKDEFETVKAELESTYDEIIDIAAAGDGFDVGEARLNEALETSSPLSYLKREYGIDFSEDESEMFTSFIEALKKMPTEYFETKFTRPVYLNEFYGAVIPSNVSDETKEILRSNGLKLVEYNDPEERTMLIRQMGEESNGSILFQAAKPGTEFQTVFHGSPHILRKAGGDVLRGEELGFDHSKMGTGEGAQAYGWGSYVTQVPSIAESYSRMGGRFTQEDFDALNIVEGLDDWKQSLAKALYENISAKTPEEILKLKEKWESSEAKVFVVGKENSLKILDYILEHPRNIQRNVYTLEIPEDGESYIQWDKEISEELYNSISENENLKDEDKAEFKKFFKIAGGQNTYNWLSDKLGSPKIASEYLFSLGYVGISYPANARSGGREDGARNYVIFNEDDIKITDWHAKDVEGNILFQTTDDIFRDALNFTDWRDFMEFEEFMNKNEPDTAIPSDAEATWYRDVWERAHQISPTTREMENAKEERRQKQYDNEKRDPIALDEKFKQFIRRGDNLETFLKMVDVINNIDIDNWQAADEIDAQERDNYDLLQRRIRSTLAHGTWASNIVRLAKGKELTPTTKARMLSLIENRVRDYRALYADITNNEEFKVLADESLDPELYDRAMKYADLKSDAERINDMSPEQKRKLEAKIKDREVLNKFKNNTNKIEDPDVEHYLTLLDSEMKALQKEVATLKDEYAQDFNRLGSMQERRILEAYNGYLSAKGEADFRKIKLPKGSAEAERLGENFKRKLAHGMKQDYSTVYNNFDTLKKELEAEIRLQERLKAENRIEELEERMKEKYNAKRVKSLADKADKIQKAKNEYQTKREEFYAVRDLRNMRKQLVKSVMRRVDFQRVDYDAVKRLIAVQNVFQPNMAGGVNKWIGTENKLAEEVWVQWRTDADFQDRLSRRLMQLGKTEILKLLADTKTEEDFENWTKKQKAALEKVMPRQNWLKELKLDMWKKEREGLIQLDIKPVMRSERVLQSDGTYKTEMVETVEFSPEIDALLRETIGEGMTDRILNKHFEDWTTEELRELAETVNRLAKEGRDKLAARKEAEKAEAKRIRNKILSNVLDTGISINEDDPADVKKKKQEKIDKILGKYKEMSGTAASQNERAQTWLDRILHGYHDMNMHRFSRMMDNQSEGEATNELYWRETYCFNTEERNKSKRTDKIEKVMKDNNIDMRDLAKIYKIDIGTGALLTFTADELCMLYAAELNQREYIQQQIEEHPEWQGLDMAKIIAIAEEESSYKAMKYGNMITTEERERFQELDRQIEEAEEERLAKLKNAIIADDKQAIEELSKVDVTKVDANGNLDRPGTRELNRIASQRWNTMLAAFEDREHYLPLINEIRNDYASEFDRMNRVSIEEFNMPVWREKWYLPLIRLEGTGDTHEARVRADLLNGMAGTGMAGTEKGFTKKRVEIGPLHQAPVELGLYKTWTDSVDRTEHFIAYAPYVRELNRVFLSKDANSFKTKVMNRYGHASYEYLDSYIKEVANPAKRDPVKGLDKAMRAMRGNVAPAYLGWKLSSIIKQGIESPAPFMQFMNPMEYAHAAYEIASSSKVRESISEKSAFMKSRVYDPMIEVVNENVEKSLNKKSYYLKKFQQKGMEGLEWIDWACVAPGWLAAYEKEYQRLQETNESQVEKRYAELVEQNNTRTGNMHLSDAQLRQQAMDDTLQNIEEMAVNHADNIVRLCQPSNRNADLAPMFKNNSEAAKAVLQFQTALNVIWQNIRYDIPYAIKNKQYKQIVGMVLGYVMAGIISGIVTEGLFKASDDDDEKTKKALQRTFYYSTTQFADSVPLLGSQIDALTKKVITGEGTYSANSSLFPVVDKAFKGAYQVTSGDFEKAAKNMGEALILSSGLPYSGLRELGYTVGAGDNEEGFDLYFQALVGRRK